MKARKGKEEEKELSPRAQNPLQSMEMPQRQKPLVVSHKSTIFCAKEKLLHSPPKI